MMSCSKSRHRRRWRKFRALSRATLRLRDARLLYQHAKGAESRARAAESVERARNMLRQAENTGFMQGRWFTSKTSRRLGNSW